MPTQVTLYIDYRSPFSYLVKDDAYAVARDFDVNLTWLPFTIDLEGAYGGTVEQRTERDWRKVKYSYMDARRMGARRNLVIRGTKKIFDTTIAHAAMLTAIRAGNDVFHRYHDIASETFWRGELDIEDAAAVRALLIDAGASGQDFDASIASGEALRQCREIVADAERLGVFGVPTFVLRETGELFWGTDRVWLLRERLRANASSSR